MRAALYLATIIALLVILVIIAGVATANAPSGKTAWYAYALQWCVVGGGALLIEAFLSMRKKEFLTEDGRFDPNKWH